MSAEWFASRLREMREQAGLTQPQLAEKVGVTTRQISRLETGAQKASWDTAMALAAALGVGVEAFAIPPQQEAPPRPRGRPRKGEDTPAPAEKPAAKKGKRKG